MTGRESPPAFSLTLPDSLPRRDLATVRYLPRSPVMSYARKRLEPRRTVATAAPASEKYPNLLAFLATNLIAWISHYLRNRFGPRHKLLDYSSAPADTGVYPLGTANEEIRVSLGGDWASGTDEAAAVAAG